MKFPFIIVLAETNHTFSAELGGTTSASSATNQADDEHSRFCPSPPRQKKHGHRSRRIEKSESVLVSSAFSGHNAVTGNGTSWTLQENANHAASDVMSLVTNNVQGSMTKAQSQPVTVTPLSLYFDDRLNLLFQPYQVTKSMDSSQQKPRTEENTTTVVVMGVSPQVNNTPSCPGVIPLQP